MRVLLAIFQRTMRRIGRIPECNLQIDISGGVGQNPRPLIRGARSSGPSRPGVSNANGPELNPNGVKRLIGVRRFNKALRMKEIGWSSGDLTLPWGMKRNAAESRSSEAHLGTGF